MHSQKRKRPSPSTSTLTPNPSNGTSPSKPLPTPPPFTAARAAIAKSYTSPAPRVLTRGHTQPAVNAALAAASRLCARDFPGAAALMPLLLRRLRVRRSIWFLPREACAVGAEVLRRSSRRRRAAAAANAELDAFLSRIVRDPASSSRSAREANGFAEKLRDAALLEMAAEMVATGRMRDALAALRAEVHAEPFSLSPLVHAYVGILNVVLAAEEEDPTAMLSAATHALDTAAKLDPSAHCFVHYAAAAAIAAGDVPRAVGLQRKFANAHSDDPLALSGLLSALTLQAKTAELSTRAERVAVSRQLLRIDPMANEALNVLQESLSWKWKLPKAVRLVEVADAVAARIECGAGDQQAWEALLALLKAATGAELAKFMFDSRRESWWMSHFFRPIRAASDVAVSTDLAVAKMGVAHILFGDCEYVAAVCAAGNVSPAVRVSAGQPDPSKGDNVRESPGGTRSGGSGAGDAERMTGVEFESGRNQCDV